MSIKKEKLLEKFVQYHTHSVFIRVFGFLIVGCYFMFLPNLKDEQFLFSALLTLFFCITPMFLSDFEIGFFINQIYKIEHNQKIDTIRLDNYYATNKLMLDAILLNNQYVNAVEFVENMEMKNIKKIPLDSILFLFKNHRLDLSNYKPTELNKAAFDAQVLRFLEKQSNPLSYEKITPPYLVNQLRIKTNNVLNIDEKELLTYLSPLKKKDLPFLYDGEKIDLNYLAYLFLIPNRKTMTIDNLRKVVSFYPHVPLNSDLIEYYKDKEITLPYSEERIVNMLHKGLNGKDLIEIGKIQEKGLAVSYPTKPKSLSHILSFLVENHISVDMLLNELSSEAQFYPFNKMPILAKLQNTKYENYTLNVIENADQLSRLGTELHLCVGGYPARGLMEEFQIIEVCENEKRKFCVSISIKSKKIAQMKKKFDLPVIELGLRKFINKQLKS